MVFVVGGCCDDDLQLINDDIYYIVYIERNFYELPRGPHCGNFSLSIIYVKSNKFRI